MLQEEKMFFYSFVYVLKKPPEKCLPPGPLPAFADALPLSQGPLLWLGSGNSCPGHPLAKVARAQKDLHLAQDGDWIPRLPSSYPDLS